MVEQTTETNQQSTTPPQKQQDDVKKVDQGTVSADQSTIKKETDQVTAPKQQQQQQQKAEDQKEPVSVQERINRMYARLQAEKGRNTQLELENKVLKTTRHAISDDDDLDDTDQSTRHVETKPGLSEADVVAILERDKKTQRFKDAEIRVFERHSEMLNEDGTWNMDHPFTQKYIEIGRRNPQLIYMENGPELAEAAAEKELGLPYRQGRTDEARRQLKVENAHTGVSTTVPINSEPVQLEDSERKIARRTGMSDKEYAEYKKSNKVPQKSWEVKAR